jgi:hypothetical protein
MNNIIIIIVIIIIFTITFFGNIVKENFERRGFVRINGGVGGDNRFTNKGVGISTTVYDVNTFAYSQNEFCSLNPGSSLCH